MEKKISIQLFTVREPIAQDLEGTLAKLAQLGYKWIEPFQGAYGGKSASEFKALIDSLGLKVSGSHVPMHELRTNLSANIDYLKAVGCHHLICAIADFSDFKHKQGVLDTAAYCNEVGRQAKAAGMYFSYHNHSHEFFEAGGKYIMDLLLENTDPALMGLELDVFWATKAGLDAAEYQAKWRERSIAVHCKDFNPKAAAPGFAPVGEGVVDFPAIFKAATKAEWFVVEQDSNGEPLQNAATSFKALTRLLA
jgi:sugar phosphate isomerase/epimerase